MVWRLSRDNILKFECLVISAISCETSSVVKCLLFSIQIQKEVRVLGFCLQEMFGGESEAVGVSKARRNVENALGQPGEMCTHVDMWFNCGYKNGAAFVYACLPKPQ